MPRFPAPELESAVKDQLLKVIRTPEIIDETCKQTSELYPDMDEAMVGVAFTKVDKIWETLFPDEQQRITKLLVERVVVAEDGLEVRLNPLGISNLANELSGVASD